VAISPVFQTGEDRIVTGTGYASKEVIMAYKADSYEVNIVNVQGKVAHKKTFSARTDAENYAKRKIKNRKMKAATINGKLWKLKGQ
jgi:hypothetical protein